MPESVGMNRVIHAAVRRDFDRLVAALAAVSDGDRRRAEGLNRAYANLRVQLTHHHEGEDQYIWPMLAGLGAEPDLLDAMEAEHHAMSEALAETSAAMDTYSNSGSVVDAVAARESAIRTQTVVESHLSHEEKDLEPVLVPYLDSPEWKEVEKKLSRQPLGVAGPFFAWVTDGLSDEDKTLLRLAVPAPVVFILSRLLGRRYYREVAPVWARAGSASPS